MFGVLALVTVLVSCYFLLRVLRPAGTAEALLVLYCLFGAHVVLLGFTLSFMNRLGDVRWWAFLGLMASSISAAVAVSRNDTLKSTARPGYRIPSPSEAARSTEIWYRKLGGFEKLVLTPLILTTLLLGFLNLMVVLFTAPTNWDSMTYHLARVAYFLQHNSLRYFISDDWAQVSHVKNGSLLLLYTYLVSGRDENLSQLVQFVSYWVAVCSVYAISTKLWHRRTESIFVAMVSALLIDWLMEATTTQNDLILTADFGATIYFLLAFREGQRSNYLVFAALALGLALGTKVSAFLALPSVALVSAFAFLRAGRDPRVQLRQSVIFVGSAVTSFCLLALPSGYVENYQHFENVFSPKDVVAETTFQGSPITYILRTGTKNVLRYGFEFISLDGMPSLGVVQRVQASIRELPVKITRMAGIDLDTFRAPDGSTFFMPVFERVPRAHEDFSYWGILGFGLIWIVVFLSIMGAIKPPHARILALAAVLFVLSQAYAGPYDRFRGRYFTEAAVFAAPTVGVCLRARNRAIRAYLLLIVLVACVSAILGVLLKNNHALISISYVGHQTTSIFAMDRMRQLSSNRVEYYEPLKNFDAAVPKDATVAISLPEDSYEYPLFGQGLTRTILPINAFDHGLQPIPASAQYLLYADGYFPCADTDDVYLGADWHLRYLTVANRNCP